MKRLGLAMLAVLFSVSLSYAKNSNNKIRKEPFAVNFQKLSKYLELAPYQVNDVANINSYFIEKQKESLKSNPKYQDKRMERAVYGNLKLMKSVLTPEQYRKYIVLLNVTNNNNRAQGVYVLSGMNLAYATQE